MQDTSKMNVVKIGDKYYVKKVKTAKCTKKIGDEYIVTCEIKMRGYNDYIYKKENDYIIKYDPLASSRPKILYLEENALNKVIDTINEFDNDIRTLDINKYRNSKYYINYKNNVDKNYDLYFEYTNNDNIIELYLLKNISICNPHLRLDLYPLTDVIITDDIENNPLYILAKERNDLVLQRKFRLFYNVETKEDIDELSKDMDYEILPKLDETFNINYVVDNISEKDIELLDNSGYHILHRPYFAMKGSTHSKWTLNPHTKGGVDAAKENADAITFEEYKNIINDNK